MTTFTAERRAAVLQFHRGAVITHTADRNGLVIAEGATALTRSYPLGTSADTLWSAAYTAVVRDALVRMLKERKPRWQR